FRHLIPGGIDWAPLDVVGPTHFVPGVEELVLLRQSSPSPEIAQPRQHCVDGSRGRAPALTCAACPGASCFSPTASGGRSWMRAGAPTDRKFPDLRARRSVTPHQA